ncbi:hypothetical protein ACFYWF_31580 [Streptomyces sp. NPDC003344]|uniref:hypothetical protein n=1 Tax=Streptomyces sp. NPDC003344 TaxID=3364682 RepID=UPI00369CFF03
MHEVTCERRSCRFPRSYRQHPKGGYRRQRHCSAECYVVARRAHGALAAGNGEEAAKLLRLIALLDARKSPLERVPEVFDRPDPNG